MIVEAYRNLHRNMWSVRDPKTGLVKYHRKALQLKDCTLIVREGGRRRVLREGKKNVHAFVRGTLTRSHNNPTRRLRYNPYKSNSFTVHGNPIKTVRRAYLAPTGKAYA